jgi:hypothetical protein
VKQFTSSLPAAYQQLTSRFTTSWPVNPLVSFRLSYFRATLDGRQSVRLKSSFSSRCPNRFAAGFRTVVEQVSD